MQITQLLDNVVHDLNDLKAINITPLDVHNLTTVTDYMVIATGSSNRHVNSIANHLLEEMKTRHFVPLSVQADCESEWIIIDLGAVVVHIMQKATREFYQLEKLWASSQSSLSFAQLTTA